MRLSSIVAPLVALTVVFLHAKSVFAAEQLFSATGSGTACSQSAPCSLTTAISNAAPTTEISCADSSDNSAPTISKSLTIDCSGTGGSIGTIAISGGAIVTLRNLTLSALNQALILESGTVILDNVHITGGAFNSIIAQPSSPSTLVVKNSVIDAGAAGVFLKPSAGGSLSARFDRVTITNNTGGGLKIDTTNGPVTVDITDSEISSNGGNGMNAVGGAGGPAIFNISRSVIAKNGAAGVQANGATAAAMVDMTLLDSNAIATSVVAGGHILTYGNNRIVGTPGSGFTSSVPLQ
jgi:Right handed beta helix region